MQRMHLRPLAKKLLRQNLPLLAQVIPRLSRRKTGNECPPRSEAVYDHSIELMARAFRGILSDGARVDLRGPVRRSGGDADFSEFHFDDLAIEWFQEEAIGAIGHGALDLARLFCRHDIDNVRSLR